MSSLHVSAIDPQRLLAIRTGRRDDAGNPPNCFVASGEEPLRCCLIRAAAGESVMLISYWPFTNPSPWTETGPVFVHAEPCSGYQTPDSLPTALRTGPRVLRTYAADWSLDYDDITVVLGNHDLEPYLVDLKGRSSVATVHVRALESQCFIYSVGRRHA